MEAASVVVGLNRRKRRKQRRLRSAKAHCNHEPWRIELCRFALLFPPFTLFPPVQMRSGMTEFGIVGHRIQISAERKSVGGVSHADGVRQRLRAIGLGEAAYKLAYQFVLFATVVFTTCSVSLA